MMVNPTSRALEFLVTASRQTPRQRNNVQLTQALQTVENTAKETGLSGDQILTLVDLGASKKFSEAMSSKLIRAMIPSTVVPEEAVVRAISWMCTNTPSVNTQALLIRWINLVYDSIETKERLHALYGILFYFLDSDTLMPHVCHLLYLLTQKEDIRMFRVRHLLNFQAAVGPQPYLMGLLSLYQLFYPNLFAMTIPRQQKVFFRQTDRVWAAAIRTVRDKNRTLEEVTVNMDTSRLQPDRSSLSRPAKRVRLEIPVVTASTSMAETTDSHIHTSLDQPAVPFTHIKDFAHLVENLDRVEMPGQIGAVLQNPLLQHAISCHQSITTAARFSMWLQHTLLEEFMNSPDMTETKQKEQLLNLIIKYSSFLQEGIPACERFLARFLSVWNGQDFRPQVFKLIATYRMCPFGRLKANILEPLRRLFFCSSLYFKCQVLVSLTALLRNYCAVEWLRCTSRPEESDSSPGEVSTAFNKKYMCLFEEDVEEFQPLGTIQRFIQYVDRVCSLAILMDPDNQLLMNFILEFYEQVCRVYTYGVPLICLPSSTVIYHMLFGPSAVTVSRLCGLLCSYKLAYNHVKGDIQGKDITSEEAGLNCFEGLNVYIMDMACSLWQYKAFQGPVCGLTIHQEPLSSLGIEHINECFSVHSHQALVGYAVKFLQETQPEGAVVHPNSIKASPKTKEIYLQYLQQEGIKGLVDFIRTFIRKVAPRRSRIGEMSSSRVGEMSTGLLQ